jgi:hypothetical protein
MSWGDLEDAPKEHSTGPCHGIVLLPPLTNGLADTFSYAFIDARQPATRLLHLSKASCVDVKSLNRDKCLTLKKAGKIVVYTLRRLWKSSCGGYDPMTAERIATGGDRSR